MRIVAGKYKGRILRSFPGREIRPTSDRLRETLFDILQAEVPGSRVWDAFAGTGALGLEALSRGASLVVLTERSREAFGLLEKNVRLLDAGDSVRLIYADAVGWAARSPWSFDLVFLDPPYNFRRYLHLALAIGTHRVCHPQGKIILEHHKRAPQVSKLLESFHPDRQVRQGDSVLSFFSGEEFIRAAGGPEAQALQ
ncbi:MAG: 16S rRNA (guanine(966)-N(2))-methyltransferase RsmD [Acidobacteria bacterium]|nr:16S rRNA (guanine(966)-N(2))-methyltransferase RsmD [Acidobacteriota bacterium]